MGARSTLVQQIHRGQRLRHVAANKLTAALTALRGLRDGQAISPTLVARAIQDLEALMRWVDREDRKRDVSERYREATRKSAKADR
jgi:hypothetical protein